MEVGEELKQKQEVGEEPRVALSPSTAPGGDPVLCAALSVPEDRFWVAPWRPCPAGAGARLGRSPLRRGPASCAHPSLGGNGW